MESKETDIYGELENGLVFLLTPPWFKDYEEDERACFEKQEESDETDKD